MSAQDADHQHPITPTPSVSPSPGGGEQGGGAKPLTSSFSALFSIVLAGAFAVSGILAVLILWLTRRRARRGMRRLRGGGGDGADVDVDAEVVLSRSSGSSGSAAASCSEVVRPSGEGSVITTVRGGAAGDLQRGRGIVPVAAGALVGGMGPSPQQGPKQQQQQQQQEKQSRRKLQKAQSGSVLGFGGISTRGMRGVDVDGGFGGGSWGGGARKGWKRYKSMPLIPRACSKGHFHFGRSESCSWPAQPGPDGIAMEEVKVSRKKPSWIDEDALHGPKVSGFREVPTQGGGGGSRKKDRGSWPLRNRAPTLPRLHHTIHGYPYPVDGSGDKEDLSGGTQTTTTTTTATGPDYAQLRALARCLPELPKPALVANRNTGVIRPSVSMGYVYGTGSSRIPKPISSPSISPVRSLPTTPSRHRGRQQSTDSTLSEILRSTEKRLRERSVPGTAQDQGIPESPTRTSPGKILGPREFGELRSRTPSPRKHSLGQPTTPAHKRQRSDQSVSSEADSLVVEECPVPDAPSGLTSPSRHLKQQQAEKAMVQAHSTRTSVSSELSTLYSEDEMPEAVKRAIMPREDLVVQPQRATGVRAPSMNDPFVAAPLPLFVSRAPPAGQAWPSRRHMSQGLLRDGMHRSQRLRSMTISQVASPQPQGLILAPGPVVHAPVQSSLPAISPSRRSSVTIPPFVQPRITSRASEPPPSPTRQSPAATSPSGPLFLRVTKTSTLSTIPRLPPPSAPRPDAQREANPASFAPAKAGHTGGDDQAQPARRTPVLMLPSTERSSASASPTRRVGGELRLSLVLAPKQLQQLQKQHQDRLSASSSVYSQEQGTASARTSASTQTSAAQTTEAAAIELNRGNFHANSSLYPAPLSPRGRRRAASQSKLSSGLGDGTHDGGEADRNGSASRQGEGEEEYDVCEEFDEQDEQAGLDEDEATPLAIASTIASLRRMNSGISTISSLRSITDRNPSPSPSSVASPSPSAVPGTNRLLNSAGGAAAGDVRTAAAAAAAATGAGASGTATVTPSAAPSSPAKQDTGEDGGSGSVDTTPTDKLRQNAYRKSIGSRNYFIIGNNNGGGQRQSRRVSRVVSAGAAGMMSGFAAAAAAAKTGAAGGPGRGIVKPPARSVSMGDWNANANASANANANVHANDNANANDNGDGSSPCKKKLRPPAVSLSSTSTRARLQKQQQQDHHNRRASAHTNAAPRNPAASESREFLLGTDEDEGKENNHGRDSPGAAAGPGGFKMAVAEFTFEVNSPGGHSAPAPAPTAGKGRLGLREGSTGSINLQVPPPQSQQEEPRHQHQHQYQHQHQANRLSLAWKAAGSEGRNGGSDSGSPARRSWSPSRGSMRSVDSIGLYDRQGFLISASPVRGVSPSGLRM